MSPAPCGASVLTLIPISATSEEDALARAEAVYNTDANQFDRFNIVGVGLQSGDVEVSR